MKTKEEIKEALKDARKAVRQFEKLDVEQDDLYIYQGWVEALEFVLKDKVKMELPETPIEVDPKIQEALRAIAQYYLYKNFWKGTNGIFCQATVVDEGTFDFWDDVMDHNSGFAQLEGWEVKIHFGQQDDTANETYTAYVQVAKQDVEAWLALPAGTPNEPCPKFQERGVGNCE